jgi:hypothetical protein
MQQPQSVIQQLDNGLQNINWASKITDVMKNQFGLKPKEPTYMYRRSYPEAYDQIAMPHRYRVPDFTKFFRQDNVTTIEHISKFLVQCGEAIWHRCSEDSSVPALFVWIGLYVVFFTAS